MFADLASKVAESLGEIFRGEPKAKNTLWASITTTCLIAFICCLLCVWVDRPVSTNWARTAILTLLMIVPQGALLGRIHTKEEKDR